MYADDYDGALPPSFEALIPEYMDNAKCFACPTCYGTTWQDLEPGGRGWRETSSSYTYVPGLVDSMSPDVIIAYETSDANHGFRGRFVMFLDANPEWWPASREAEFQQKLSSQREAMKKWRAAGAKKEDIPKFFGAKESTP